MTIGQSGVPPVPAAAAESRGGSQSPVPAAPVSRPAAGPRQWSARGVALAVLVVVLGGLVLLYAVPQFSHRVTVLAVATDVPVGSVITADDLTTAKITVDPHLRSVPAADRAAVVGKVAAVSLRAGTLVTLDGVGTSDGFTAGQVLVPLGLKAGQFPARGLDPGQHVWIIATPGTGNAGGGAAVSAAATEAVVAEVGRTDDATGVTVIDVRVPSAAAVALGQFASTGNLLVLLLPTGG